MLTIIWFLLAAVGMTHVVVDGNVADPFRRFMKWISKKLINYINPQPEDTWYLKTMKWFAEIPGEVVDCHQCSGFWCGIICGYILVCHHFWMLIMCGFANSIAALAVAYVLTYLQARSIVDIGPLEPMKDKK